MSSPPPNAVNSKFRGREWRRFLLATVAITLLYLGVQTIWMFGASHLAHIGWTVNDPAKTYAAEAAAIAEKTRAREATLDPQFARRTFELGFEYGYLSQWLGGYGRQSDEIMRQLSRPVDGHIRRLNELAEQLGVAPIDRLPVNTAADFGELTQRIEADPAGAAGRIEQAGSLRLRHLFLFGAQWAAVAWACWALAAVWSLRLCCPAGWGYARRWRRVCRWPWWHRVRSSR